MTWANNGQEQTSPKYIQSNAQNKAKEQEDKEGKLQEVSNLEDQVKTDENVNEQNMMEAFQSLERVIIGTMEKQYEDVRRSQHCSEVRILEK